MAHAQQQKHHEWLKGELSICIFLVVYLAMIMHQVVFAFKMDPDTIYLLKIKLRGNHEKATKGVRYFSIEKVVDSDWKYIIRILLNQL